MTKRNAFPNGNDKTFEMNTILTLHEASHPVTPLHYLNEKGTNVPLDLK